MSSIHQHYRIGRTDQPEIALPPEPDETDECCCLGNAEQQHPPEQRSITVSHLGPELSTRSLPVSSVNRRSNRSVTIMMTSLSVSLIVAHAFELFLPSMTVLLFLTA
jgi:hypothetical protein